MHCIHFGYSPIKHFSFWPLTCKCDLDLPVTGLWLVRHMSPHHGEHDCVPNNLGNSVMHGISFRPLTSKYDIDLWGTGLCLVCHMSTYHGEHVCQVTWESYDALLRCGPDKEQSYQTVLILTSECDLDIWGTCLGLVRDTPPYDGEHVCLVTWESYDAWLRCEQDKVQSFLSNSTHFDFWPA